jgi:molybdate transport system regulatory protein
MLHNGWNNLTLILTKENAMSNNSTTTKTKTKSDLHLQGKLWLELEPQKLLSPSRIELLKAIAKTGSISAAARHLEMSYKGAWDAVDGMNNLSDMTIVARSTGGKRGGGAVLTPYGIQMLDFYELAQVEHVKFIERLSGRIGELGRFFNFLRSVNMRTSARNQIAGKVLEIKKGAVNSEVVVGMSNGEQIISVITNDGVDALGLKTGVDAYCIFKAQSVLLSKGETAPSISARNKIKGTISEVIDGAVNCEIKITSVAGVAITAIVTEDAKKELALAKGDTVYAIIKASSIIIGVE